MAREMALAGVSEEELKKDDTPMQPLTPKQKRQNFWYYYKWWILSGIAILIIISVCVWQMVTTVEPDYLCVLVTRDVLNDADVTSMELDMQKVAEDLNGDGKIKIQVENLALSQYAGGVRNPQAEMNSQKLMAYLVSADAMFYVFDDTCYKDYLAKLKESAADGIFFDTLNVTDKGYNEEEHYWNWAEDERSTSYWGTEMPKNLYFGVRLMGGTAKGEKVQKRHDDCQKLLETYIQTKTVE